MNVPAPLLAYAFRCCVAYFNAKPWKLFGETDVVRLGMDEGSPWLAQASGAANGQAGFSFFREQSGVTSGESPDQHSTNMVERLSMVFVPESAVPQETRDTRRANKWPLASPAAFPTFAFTDVDGVASEPSAEGLRRLCVAMSVITTFVATRRKQIAAGEPYSDTIVVRDDLGRECVALVQFPPTDSNQSGWQNFKMPENQNTSLNPALRELTNAALDLPNTAAALDRLAWSFFQDMMPGYLHDGDEQDDAMERFVSWALFAHTTSAGTLAQQALRVLQDTKADDALETHRRIVHPRSGIFRVLDAKRNAGMHVRDEILGDTLYILERIESRRLTADSGVLGMLHPISDEQWILAPGATMYPSLPEMESRDDEPDDVVRFAPEMEASVFGANTEWIQAIETGDIQDEYEAFGESLRAAGAELPVYADLQRSIASAAQPGDVVREISATVDWWSDAELNVTLAFVMRAWNATPRAELGGVSPDEKAASGERVRAKRGGGRRR